MLFYQNAWFECRLWQIKETHQGEVVNYYQELQRFHTICYNVFFAKMHLTEDLSYASTLRDLTTDPKKFPEGEAHLPLKHKILSERCDFLSKSVEELAKFQLLFAEGGAEHTKSKQKLNGIMIRAAKLENMYKYGLAARAEHVKSIDTMIDANARSLIREYTFSPTYRR